MVLMSVFAWLRVVISHQGESVPGLFLLSGAAISMIGGAITIDLAQRYCRMERERREAEATDAP